MRAPEPIRGIKNEIGVALAIFRTARNPLSYLLFRMHLSESATLFLKFRANSELLLSRRNATITYKGRNFVFEYNTKTLRFVPLALCEIFAYGSYEELNVKGKEVVDIGASIGDTAIYFLANGARRVYCFETSPYRFSVSKRNLRMNGYLQKVKLFNKEFDFRTLHLRGSSNALKVDCEGCEYALFDAGGSALKYIASKFNQIVMEYHNGDTEIRKALEQHGYLVKVSRTSRSRGILYAKKA
jgi:precorrin-6B methylase 2